MNKQLLNKINKNLYDVQSSIESTEEVFKKYNIDVVEFLKTIELYIINFHHLKKNNNENLLKLLDEKLEYILKHYEHISLYEVKIKSSINFIEKHITTFLGLIKFKKSNLPIHVISYFDENKNIYVDVIKIKNYFSIKNIEITNLKDKKEIYFVGENGDGKTILLQAILLALKKDYSGNVIEHIKNIEDKLELSVKVDSSDEYFHALNVTNIFAYGINRNKVDYKEYDPYGYGGLFDTSDSRKTTYLKDPFYELGKEYKGKNTILKEFIKKLNTIILKENYKIFEDEQIDFNELSEGYKSTIIWLYDLISRLIENQPKVEKIADFKAIVLIDEVDLYLHPTWKYDFVYNLRKVFPNIQFIMITHSIVTILGASKDAVFYKVYKEDGKTKISHQIKNRGYTNNTLSSSPLFDMDSVTSRNYNQRKLSEDDYVYEKIHDVVSKKIKEDSIVDEDMILKLIEKEFDKHEKS